MASSLSNLVNRFMKGIEGIHKIKLKFGLEKLNVKRRDCFLECKNFKDDLI